MKSRTFSLYLIFFPTGLAVLANAQRYPELRNQLHLTNGEFGTYISLAAVGAVIAFILGSRIIHSFGIGKTLLFGFIGLYSSVATFPHCHRPFSFIVTNLAFGFFSTLNHINMNAQGIHVQNKSNELLLPFLAGMWSSGAVSATLISILVSKKVSLCWQVDAIALCGFLMALIGLIGSRKDLMNPREEYVAAPRITPRNVLSTFKFVPYLSFGHILILQSEYAAGDWSAIYARNTIGVSVSEASYCYLVFIVSMGVLRIFGSKINKKYSEAEIIKWVPRFGAVGFSIFLVLGTLIARENRNLAFISSLVAFTFLGIGNSFIVLLLFGMAARKSNLMPGAVIAAMGLVGAVFSFVVKFIIAWVAQATNLTIALMIPTIMLFLGSSLSKYGERIPKSR